MMALIYPQKLLSVASTLLLVGKGEHLQEKLAIGDGSNVKNKTKQKLAESLGSARKRKGRNKRKWMCGEVA